MSGSRWHGWAWVLALAVTGVAVAEDAPSAGPATRQVSARAEGGGAASRPWKSKRMGGANADVPTEEEWRGVVEFMREYSPNRLKAIEEQRAGERYGGLRKVVWGHYQDLISAKERGDQELYDLKLALVKGDDDLWGLQRQVRDASEGDRPVLRHQLRQKIGEVVKLGLKERAARIARLEKALADEKEKLASDEQNVSQRVDDRMRVMLRGTGTQRRGEEGKATTTVGSEVK